VTGEEDVPVTLRFGGGIEGIAPASGGGASTEPLIDAELDLRRRALAEPVGLSLSGVRFPFEDSSLHLWAVRGRQLVGCVLFYREDERSGRLYQMAVEHALRGRGVGRMLVRQLEARLRQLGVREIRLHARGPVVGFYEQLGYVSYDEPFLEVGIEHRRMRKGL
jgi:ribosomal protein S18 acetylase RimI-like enzyme